MGFINPKMKWGLLIRKQNKVRLEVYKIIISTIIGFPIQFNIYSMQIDFQIIQFRANLNAHLKVYFNLQIRIFNFNNCSSDLVHQSFNLIKQAFNRQKGSIYFIKSARN